jgi:hypothetical protein
MSALTNEDANRAANLVHRICDEDNEAFVQIVLQLIEDVRTDERQRRERAPSVDKKRRIESAKRWLRQAGVEAVLGDANTSALAEDMAATWEPMTAGVELTAKVSAVGRAADIGLADHGNLSVVVLMPDEPHHWEGVTLGKPVKVMWSSPSSCPAPDEGKSQ